MTKFADDTTSTNRVQVESLIHWCNENNLLLNVSKTKEMIFYFRRKKPDMQPLSIGDGLVNCTEILKKARQRLYFFFGS